MVRVRTSRKRVAMPESSSRSPPTSRCGPALEALGPDIQELFDILTPWGEAIRAGRGYLGAGPHDLG